jgi:hypothetical protein
MNGIACEEPRSGGRLARACVSLRPVVQNPLLELILLGDDLMVAVPRGMSRLMAALLRRLSCPDVSGRHFYTRNPAADIGSNRPVLMSLVFARLARLDRAYGPKAALVSLRPSTMEGSDFSI